MHLLKAKNLSVTYPNGEKALDQFDLTIDHGEAVLVAGGTGSGKSTLAQRLLNVIPNQVKATCEGDILFSNEPIKDIPTHHLAKQIQLILQNPEAMLFALNVEGNIHFGLENHCLEKNEILKKTEEILTLMRLNSFRKRSPMELSGGEQQAAAIASVLALEPTLYILDEPLTYLDQSGKKRLLEHLQQLKKLGKSILILEHRLDLAQEIADRIVVLKEGKKVLDVEPSAVSSNELQENLGLRTGTTFSFNASTDEQKEIASVLEFKDISFSYPSDNKVTTPILKNISLQINTQERIALLGANGSGKSTLATCAIGLDKPQKGSILLKNRPLSKYSTVERAKEIGLMFQKPESQLFCRSVWEELFFGGKNLNIAEEELCERVNLEAKGLGLSHLMKKHPATLSRGEMRRLALASLLIMQPSILILDEPTIGQDYFNLNKIGNRLLEANHSGTTLILITHDQEFAQQLATRTILIEKGEIKDHAYLRTL